MASRHVSDTAYRSAMSGVFNRNVTSSAFNSTSNQVGRNADMSLPSPNSLEAIGVENNNITETDTSAADGGTTFRTTKGLCNFYSIEYMINKRYHFNSGVHKNLRTLQQTIGEKKRPCLFDLAVLFGGSECSSEVFNGLCSFHWSMLNLRVAVCEQYNTNNKRDGTFYHYELLVDCPIPDRVIVPIFPNVTGQTSLWDLMFGFTYATNRGLLTTKINEGAAMAYALYYMMDAQCVVEFLARATYWAQSMTEYLMACVFYNDELAKDVYASRFPDVQNTGDNPACPSVLKNIFTKNVYSQDVTFDTDMSKIRLPPGMENVLSYKDARLVRNLPAQSGEMRTEGADGIGTTGQGNDANPSNVPHNVTGTRTQHRSTMYRQFSIFVAPLILSLRPSTYVTDMFVYGAPPVIGLFRMRFRNTPSTSHGHSVFAIQGPVQYGVAPARANRNLPFTTDMPTCTQAYVATLGSVANIDVNEDRIFASELAKFKEITINNSEQMFRVNASL